MRSGCLPVLPNLALVCLPGELPGLNATEPNEPRVRYRGGEVAMSEGSVPALAI